MRGARRHGFAGLRLAGRGTPRAGGRRTHPDGVPAGHRGPRLGGVIAPPEEVVRRAALTLLREERLDTTVLAAELGISRVTLFRRVGNRDAILGEALWWLAERTLHQAAEDHDARSRADGDPDRLRSLAVIEDFRS